MSIIDDIKMCFASLKEGAIRPLLSIGEQYKAYAVKTNENYGVAIEFPREIDVYETFANAKIETRNFTFIVDGEEKCGRYLYFYSSNFMLRNEFAIICKHFVDPGVDGSARMRILNDPYGWWESWKSLLGNAEKNLTSYSILAELLVYKQIVLENKNVDWTAVYNGTHDFEGKDFCCEVKSTLKKYDLSISINSQNQLHSDKTIYLYFCRLEKSNHGVSINDLINDLVRLGVSKEDLEDQMTILGLKKGKVSRNERYVIRDQRKFTIDENFPKISIFDISNSKFRDKILKLVYTIDLSGIEYESW